MAAPAMGGNVSNILNGPPGAQAKIVLNNGANAVDQNKIAQYNQQQGVQQAEAKDLFTKFVTVLAEGRGQGRANVPAYNKHEAQGMGGLNDPAALGYQTVLPVPFEQSYAGTANLLGIINSIGPERFNMNYKIVYMADSQTPQLKKALEQPYTIYEQYPDNYYSRRLNIELQRKRVYSMYSFV